MALSVSLAFVSQDPRKQIAPGGSKANLGHHQGGAGEGLVGRGVLGTVQGLGAPEEAKWWKEQETTGGALVVSAAERPQSGDRNGYGNGMELGVGGKGEQTGELCGAGKGVKGRFVCWGEERSRLLRSSPVEPGSWAAQTGDGRGARTCRVVASGVQHP